MTTNREFKFACPVCQQHLQCEVAAAGRVVTCPTCFRSLIVPEAMTGHLARLIVRAKEANPLPAPSPKATAAAIPAMGSIGRGKAIFGVIVAAMFSVMFYVLIH